MLIVEDEALMRLVVSDYLQDCGFKVLEAANAQEAIAMICQAAVKIDIVFSDVRMPGEMNGVGLARWMRGNRPDIPVVLTSGGLDTELANTITAQGPFLAKPYKLERLVSEMGRMLGLAPSSEQQ